MPTTWPSSNALDQEGVARWSASPLIYGFGRWAAAGPYHWAPWPRAGWSGSACLCGTARTTPTNRLFLASACARPFTAVSRLGWNAASGRRPEPGARTFALIYAHSWAPSQASTGRAGPTKPWGYGQAFEAYVGAQWLPAYRRHDPHELCAMLDTWLSQ